jgi:polysaccharide export outer membrane protein
MVPRNLPRILAASLLATAVASLAPACATTHPYFNYAAEPDPRKQEYVLGASDVLRVNVWHNPDLSGEAVIRPDGTISLPLIGDIRAAGRTAGQVREEIAQRLRTFVKDESAVVTVAVSAINSYRFTVSGNVEHSGTFSSNHFVTLTEAIALAGGPSRFASAEDSVVIRPIAGANPKRIPIDYPAILQGKHPEQDLPVLSGDVIYVP